MNKPYRTSIEGDLLDEYSELSVSDLCRACDLSAEKLIDMVEYGVLEPKKGKQVTQWRFNGLSIQRLRCAVRLEQDLGVNLAGVALALDLIEEVNRLRQQLRRYQGFREASVD